jgi:hypothetical protein
MHTGFQEILEEGAVVDHRLSKIFRTRLAVLALLGDGVSGSIVLDHLGMIDRDVGRSLLEVADGVAASLHHFADQPVGFSDGPPRVVDELRLTRTPALRKLVALLWRKRSNLQALDSLLAVYQVLFGLATIALLFLHRAIVLRPELATQILGSSLLLIQPYRDTNDDQQRNYQTQDKRIIHTGVLSLRYTAP